MGCMGCSDRFILAIAHCSSSLTKLDILWRVRSNDQFHDISVKDECWNFENYSVIQHKCHHLNRSIVNSDENRFAQMCHCKQSF